MSNSSPSIDNVAHIAGALRFIRDERFDIYEDRNSTKIRDEYYAVFSISKHKNYFLQAITSAKDKILLECSAIHPSQYKISKNSKRELISNGWIEPTKHNPNYHQEVDISDDKESYLAAIEILQAAIIAFNFEPNDSIEIRTGSVENVYPRTSFLQKLARYFKSSLTWIIEKI